MSSVLIRNASIVNEGTIQKGDLLIKDELIAAIGDIDAASVPKGTKEINASGLYLIPGIIDDQVHFRDPGLTHKGDIFSESRAAAAGGVTSFMDMPNTIPQSITNLILEEKYKSGAENSLINFSFYIGGTNTNINELLDTDPETVCGVKLFLGSSTGNMLVNDENTLREIFSKVQMLIACHCEDEETVKKNSEIYRLKFGEDIPVKYHPLIRSREACFKTSSYAIKLAKEYNARVHILHLSTADEVKLFENSLPLAKKRITGEVCVHHLWFDEEDYNKLDSLIKWNPSIKTSFDRDALVKAVNSDLIDIVATDHAPHTLSEKSQSYFKCPSGGPLIQHSLVAMMELHHKGIFSMEKIVEKMCHNPAILYRIKERGFIRENYKADLCLVNPSLPWSVSKENILYKCGWSPFMGNTFSSKVITTIVNGNIVYDNGEIDDSYRGQRLKFFIKN
jgi:dihydroorotase